MTITRNTII